MDEGSEKTPVAVISISDALFDELSERDRNRAIRKTLRTIVTLAESGLSLVIVPSGHSALDQAMVRCEEASTKLPIPSISQVLPGAHGEVTARFKRELMTLARKENVSLQVAAIQTHVLASVQDPGLSEPGLSVGPVVSSWRAKELMRNSELTLTEQGPNRWRRQIGSVSPLDIMNLDSLSLLVDAGHVVIAGAGVPVAIDAKGEWAGLEACVTAETTAALYAEHLGADYLIYLTPKEHLVLREGRPDQQILGHVSTAQFGQYVSDEAFENVAIPLDATLSFLESGGLRAIITHPDKLAASLADRDGTRIGISLQTETLRNQLNLFG